VQAYEKNEVMAANLLFEKAEPPKEEIEEGLMASGGGAPTGPVQIPPTPAPGSEPRPMPGPPLMSGLGSAPTTLLAHVQCLHQVLLILLKRKERRQKEEEVCS